MVSPFCSWARWLGRVSPFLGVGALLLVASAASAAPKVYVGNFKDNAVSVFDSATETLLTSIPVASGPHGITISADGRWVYVAGENSSQVSVIDSKTDTVDHALNVGKGPHGVTLTPDGKLALVAVNGDDKVAVVDIASQKVIGAIPVLKPHTIAISPDSRRAYVASQEPGHFALAVVDVSGRTVVHTIPLEKPPRDVEFGNAGKSVFFTMAGMTGVHVVDPSTDKVVAVVPTGVSPHVAMQVPGTPYGLVVVQGPGELQVFDPATDQALQKIAVGKQPHWVAETSDGRMAYVTNEGADSMTVIELASGKTHTIPVGHGPRKVAVQPGGAAHVSINNFQFGPAAIKVAQGQTVLWSNDDGAPHAVHFDALAVDAPLLPGEKFSRAFDRAGTFAYYCSVHNYMRGSVVVD